MMKAVQYLLDLFYPPKCVFCGKLLQARETEICAACRRELPEIRESIKRGEFFRECCSVFYYEGNVRDSVRRFKFSGMEFYARCYGRLLAMKLLSEQVEFDLLTWVPVSKKRRRERGYDHARLLAEATASELGEFCTPTLTKTRHNQAQSSLHNAAERKANVLGAYKCIEDVAGKRILLIDDIITTGATLSECSRVLLTAGAKSVTCGTLAATRASDGQNHTSS